MKFMLNRYNVDDSHNTTAYDKCTNIGMYYADKSLYVVE